MGANGSATIRRRRAAQAPPVRRACARLEAKPSRCGHTRTEGGGRLQDPELRHEARAALLGIEAAAAGCRSHRSLTPEQLDELSNGLLAEVRWLVALLDGGSRAPSRFDLRTAITPVITCARAHGVEVRSSVPAGVEVIGVADSTAQVLRALLTNAQRHAPGSPIDVRLSQSSSGTELYVEDRGPGMPELARKRVFERHIRA